MISNININHHLITALMERWRTKINTLHLSHVNSIVTIENVTLQLGVPIDSEPIIRVNNCDLVALCQQLLRSILPLNIIKGNTIKLSWLNKKFQQLLDDATNDVIARHVQMHILSLIESLLVPNTSTSRVHLMYLFIIGLLNTCLKL